MATNDPNSAGRKPHDGRTSDSGCARPSHRPVPDHHWDEVENSCPLPARKLARNPQGGFGFYVGLALGHKGKGIRDAEDRCRAAPRADVPRPTGSGQIATAIMFAYEAASARAQDAYPVDRIKPCGELTPPGLIGSTTIGGTACMEKANTLQDGRRNRAREMARLNDHRRFQMASGGPPLPRAAARRFSYFTARDYPGVERRASVGSGAIACAGCYKQHGTATILCRRGVKKVVNGLS